MLVDSHGQPLNPKLREETSRQHLGWIIAKMVEPGVYIPVRDSSGALGIAPSAKAAEDLAHMLCQRELQPKPGAMLKPGQESSTYVVLKLVGESFVQVKIDDASKLNGGKGG